MNDVITTKVTKNTVTVHNVGIVIANAPKTKTNWYYYPEMEYTPERLVVVWHEGQQATGIDVYGTADNGNDYKGSWGLKQAPEWIKQTVIDEIGQAAGWDWEWPKR